MPLQKFTKLLERYILYEILFFDFLIKTLDNILLWKYNKYEIYFLGRIKGKENE